MSTKLPCSDTLSDGFRTDSADSEVTTIRELIDRMARIKGETPFLLSPETREVLSFAWIAGTIASDFGPAAASRTGARRQGRLLDGQRAVYRPAVPGDDVRRLGHRCR